jgi:hypothetical protein
LLQHLSPYLPRYKALNDVLFAGYSQQRTLLFGRGSRHFKASGDPAAAAVKLPLVKVV